MKYKHRIISAAVYREKGCAVGFEIREHGRRIVCAAVSALAINAINSIKTLTDAKFSCEYDENGGYLSFKLERGDEGYPPEALLLTESLYLGLCSVQDEYPGDISVITVIKEV